MQSLDYQKPSFMRDHADTLAIIGVNIAIAAVLISLWISHSHRIDAMSARSDAIMTRVDTLHVVIIDMLRNGGK